MNLKVTAEEIKQHIESLIKSRLLTQDLAHEEFNKGVKFATDYVLEFVEGTHNTKLRDEKATSWWKRFVSKWVM